jgi:hypothetical protein
VGTNEQVKLGPVESGLLNDLRRLAARALDPRYQAELVGSRV